MSFVYFSLLYLGLDTGIGIGMGTIPISSTDTANTCELGLSIDNSTKLATVVSIPSLLCLWLACYV